MTTPDPGAPDGTDEADQRVADSDAAGLHEPAEGETQGDLSRTERRALELIRARGGLYQSELWKELDVSSRTGTRIARTLADRGLVERTESTYQGRKTYLLSLVEREFGGTGRSTTRRRSSTEPPDSGGDTPQPEGGPASTDTEQRALELLTERGPVPQSELFQLLDLSPQTGQQLVRTLLDADRIEREETTLYGRQTYLLVPVERGSR